MNSTPKETIRETARIIWDFLKVDMPLIKSDGILIFGSNDLRVPEYAARLYHEKWAPWICPSGGVGRLTYNLYHKPEAEAFAEVLRNAGVPDNAIYIESKATNTAENIFLSQKVLKKNGLSPKKLIVLQKPYMERRTLAALNQYWPQISFCVSSPPIPFDNYPFPGFSMNDLIHVMVGDFQRIILYAERGWQTPQPVPDRVMAAYQELIMAGYTRELADSSAKPATPDQPA
jgi:uncharacterized SAM-binding protein YcdF (DUF218 family)